MGVTGNEHYASEDTSVNPKQKYPRRLFLKAAGAAALGASGMLALGGCATSYVVTNSSGSARPRLKAPANACDAHIHVYDDRFVMSGPKSLMPTHATVADYRALQRRNGTTRTVVVTPANYLTDNSVTLDAVAQLGLAQARGIAVIHPDVSDAELKRLHDGGVRGIRFTVFNPKTSVTKVEMIEPLSKRVHALGWHVQIHMRGDQIVEYAELFPRLPSPIVFDHLGRLAPAAGVNDPAFGIVRRLIDKGQAWVKLSGAYLNTKVGPPSYADATAVARAYVTAAPQRLVWGSDWPHPTEAHEKPDDALLFDLLAEWVPEEKTRQRILVENPETLYGFGKSV